jgi:hypothetical protein
MYLVFDIVLYQVPIAKFRLVLIIYNRLICNGRFEKMYFGIEIFTQIDCPVKFFPCFRLEINRKYYICKTVFSEGLSCTTRKGTLLFTITLSAQLPVSFCMPFTPWVPIITILASFSEAYLPMVLKMVPKYYIARFSPFFHEIFADQFKLVFCLFLFCS